jgi:hypothetical protein
MHRYLYVACIVLASAALAHAATPDEQALINWVVSNGGTVSATLVVRLLHDNLGKEQQSVHPNPLHKDLKWALHE